MTATPSGTTSRPMPSPAMTATRYLFAIPTSVAARIPALPSPAGRGGSGRGVSLARFAGKCGFFAWSVEPGSEPAVIADGRLTEMSNEGHAMPFDGVGFDDSLQKIDAVIDLLALPDKWCKGALRSHDGRYCIRGAVRAVGAADALESNIL